VSWWALRIRWGEEKNETGGDSSKWNNTIRGRGRSTNNFVFLRYVFGPPLHSPATVFLVTAGTDFFFLFYRTIQQSLSHETVDASCAQLVLFSLQYQHCFPFHNFRPPTIPPRNTGYLRFPSRVLALFPPALPLTELRRKGAGGGKKINPFFPGTYEGKNRIRYIFTAHASCVCRIQFGRSSGGSEEGDLSWVPLIFTTT